MDMALENYRWIMSTVPQVLGAITAIILAGFFIWVEQLKTKVKAAISAFNDICIKRPDIIDTIVKHDMFTGKNSDCLYDEIDEFRMSLFVMGESFEIGSDLDMYTFYLEQHKFTAERNKRMIEKAKTIRTAILFSGLTIIISLLFLILGKLIEDISFLKVPLYITSGMILASTALCMYLYFRWLSKMIFSTSSDM